jgi:hypothetical protein
LVQAKGGGSVRTNFVQTRYEFATAAADDGNMRTLAAVTGTLTTIILLLPH